MNEPTNTRAAWIGFATTTGLIGGSILIAIVGVKAIFWMLGM